MQQSTKSNHIPEYMKDVAMGVFILLLILFMFYARRILYVEADGWVHLGDHTIGWRRLRDMVVGIGGCVLAIYLYNKPLRYKYLVLGLLLGYYAEYISSSYGLSNGIMTYIEWGWK